MTTAKPIPKSKKMKVYLDTVGCRLNQSEIETMGQQLRADGHNLVAGPQAADLAVINTCAVTVQAAADSRKMVRRAARQGAGQIVVTGCWASFDPAAAAGLPRVARVVPNVGKEQLVADLLGPSSKQAFDLEPVAREALPGARLRTRAFIKVQDGSDNRCTFCITTLLRGAGRSRPVEQVLADVEAAVRGGVQEVVLTGVHLGSWGQDFPGAEKLKDLVESVLERTAVARLRLSSLEPWDLDEDFFALWQDQPRLCRHLHLPLQSGCDATLRRMARKTTRKSFRRLVQAARRSCPEMAITTDLIAGFPGETEAEFQQTMQFVAEMSFSGAHVFTYSERPGTAAASMPDPVPHQLRKERNARLRLLVGESAAHYRTRFRGKSLAVLWESAVGLGPQGWQVSGLSDNSLRVQANTSQDLWNTITPVRITKTSDRVMEGTVAHG